MTDTNQRALLRSLPQVEELLSSPALERAVQRLSRRFVADCAREAVAQARADVLAGRADQVDVDAIAADAARRALALADPSLRRAVNATGVVVHTNLGRSPLSKIVGSGIHVPADFPKKNSGLAPEGSLYWRALGPVTRHCGVPQWPLKSKYLGGPGGSPLAPLSPFLLD